MDLAATLEVSGENRLQWPELYLGKKGHRAGPVRLVAFRLSPESAARHRQGLRQSMRTQGRTPSAKALQLAGWLLLVTNAPAQKLPSSMMSYLYRLRWQVELIFRQTKSVLRLDKTECNDPSRVQCEIWARLICAVLLFLWHAHASAESIELIWQLWRARPGNILVPGHDLPMLQDDGVPRYLGEREAAIRAWFDDDLEKTTLFRLNVGS